MASTPLLDAASSSCTLRELPCVISTHEVHTPQGSPSTGGTSGVGVGGFGEALKGLEDIAALGGDLFQQRKVAAPAPTCRPRRASPAPPTARLPRCTKCQSFAKPSSDEYSHIGETAIRLRNVISRIF